MIDDIDATLRSQLSEARASQTPPWLAATKMTSEESLPLPHLQLTPITGKPTAAAIRQLKKELYANARSIHLDRGGGLNKHLGLVMPTAAYVI
jgi:hypothetical protein